MGKPVALVTGARQGLGRGIALSLAKKGFDVAALDLFDDEKAEALVSEIEALGAKAYFGQMDLAETETHAEAVAKAEEALGPITALVNNAGIASRPLTDILDLGTDAFDKVMNINLRGSLFFTQAVARRMLEQQTEAYRSITFIASIAAEFAATDRTPYCVSKSGLSMVVKLFADRLGAHGIAVHEVRPGFIRTEMTGSAPTDKIDGYISSGRVAQKRWGQTPDVATVVSTLASGLMPYVTGQPIYVDGGFHIPTV
jgi:NAD(P)-dependent dehydrogenase (short-subunit alcohol dehydrogenase family)